MTIEDEQGTARGEGVVGPGEWGEGSKKPEGGDGDGRTAQGTQPALADGQGGGRGGGAIGGSLNKPHKCLRTVPRT